MNEKERAAWERADQLWEAFHRGDVNWKPVSQAHNDAAVAGRAADRRKVFTTFAPGAIASATWFFNPSKPMKAGRRRGYRGRFIWFGSIGFWILFWYFALVALGVWWILKIALWLTSVVLILVAQLVWWIVQSPWVLFHHETKTYDRPRTHKRPSSAEGWAQKRWEQR